MKQAVKLAGWKPFKNQTRNDLLVYGGWLTSRWGWSRDVEVSLDDAIANAKRLGEDVRIVGNPKPAERKKVRGRKRSINMREEESPKVRPPMQAKELSNAPVPGQPQKEVEPAIQAETEPFEIPGRQEPVVEVGETRPLAVATPESSAPRIPPKAKEPIPPHASSLLLQRFLIAAALCSVALFLGYFGFASSVYVLILLMADAFFVVATSILALRERRSFEDRRHGAPVSGRDAPAGNSKTVS
jgi:hypothetical protein